MAVFTFNGFLLLLLLLLVYFQPTSSAFDKKGKGKDLLCRQEQDFKEINLLMSVACKCDKCYFLVFVCLISSPVSDNHSTLNFTEGSSSSSSVFSGNDVLDKSLKSPELPEFTEQPRDSFVVKNRPAILNCSVLHSDKAYFTCNGEAQSKSGDHVEKNLVDDEGRVVRILSLVIYREQV